MGAQISLRHFRCFAAVARTGSFTVAAQQLFKTQSSLTATIKQLEDLAGVQLFDRTTRRVELTRDAIWFQEVTERILRDFDNAVTDLQAVARSEHGNIKISVAPSLMPHVLAPTLVAFRRSYPDVKISVRDEGSDKTERSVLDGTTDFGISSALNNFADLDYRPLLADPFGAVFPKGHALAEFKGKLTWADLRDYEYVSLTKDTGIGSLIRHYPDLEPKHQGTEVDHASSTTSLYALLKLGNRITVLPALAAHTDPMSEFEFRELHEPKIEREVCVITRHMRSSSPTTRRILEILTKTIRESKPVHGVRILDPETELSASFVNGRPGGTIRQ